MSDTAARLALEVDWTSLADVLRWRRLLPTLGPRILELAGRHPTADFETAVRLSLEAGRRQGALLQFAGSRVISALADSGICCASLKGPALGERLYGDPGRRLSGDVDLLVAPEQLHHAVDVVRTLGYSAPEDHVESRGLPLLHFALVHERGELPPVELHWRIHWYERSFARDRLLPQSGLAPSSEWRPALVDELAALLLFYARDGFIDLRQATDLSAWWDAFGLELSIGEMDELLALYPALSRVLCVSASAAQRTTGLPAGQVVQTTPKLRLRDRTAVRLANPNPRAGSSQLYADRGLIDGLLMPPGDFVAFVRRQVFLPRAVLDGRASRASQRRLRSLLGRNGRVLLRCGVLVRYGLTMTRLARAPEVLR